MKSLLVAALLVTMAFGGLAQRTGGWLDEIVFVLEPDQGKAIAKLAAGEIDVFTNSVGDPVLFAQVRANPDLKYYQSFGLFFDITMNHGGKDGAFFADGRLNPFGVQAIREAVHWLLDREYISNEILGGLAIPKYTRATYGFPDYEALRPILEQIEDYYRYDFDKANAVITAEMTKLGATKVGGKWTYGGKPVELIFLIRENQRTLIGNFLADELEKVGFTVVRRYGLGRELAPLWQTPAPSEGTFSLYTGGWIGGQIDRDVAGAFRQYYTNLTMPFYAQWNPDHFPEDPLLADIADRMYRRDYSSLEERSVLLEQALWLSMEFANMIWVVDENGFQPTRNNVALAADLAGGIGYATLAGPTFQFQKDGRPVEGGKMTIAQVDMFVHPMNPIAGSNWVYEQMPARITGSTGLAIDPNTGLYWPLRAERAEVTVLSGLPVGVTNTEWCTLKFADEIKVPADAWVDWDAAKQVFITAGEKYPEGLTAKRKSVIYYPADLYNVKMHDGNTISAGDFVMGMILTFDRGKPESAIYDEAVVAALASTLKNLRGIRIVSTNPLVIETYSETWYLDAEWAVSDWFPYYSYGQGFWHVLAVGILAEQNKELAFSQSKSTALKVEWMNMIAGPSLTVLAKYLGQAKATAYIPYAPTLSKFITEAEAKTRYANLEKWYQTLGHFWVGAGPYYLERAFTTEKVIVLKQFADYPDAADRFQRFVR